MSKATCTSCGHPHHYGVCCHKDPHQTKCTCECTVNPPNTSSCQTPGCGTYYYAETTLLSPDGTTKKKLCGNCAQAYKIEGWKAVE